MNIILILINSRALFVIIIIFHSLSDDVGFGNWAYNNLSRFLRYLEVLMQDVCCSQQHCLLIMIWPMPNVLRWCHSLDGITPRAHTTTGTTITFFCQSLSTSVCRLLHFVIHLLGL